MSAGRDRSGPLFGIVCFVALLVAGLWQFAASGSGAAGGALAVEPSLGAPTETFIGASPLEAAGEVWATAPSGTDSLARYTDAGGWEVMPTVLDAGGQPIEPLRFVGEAGVGRTTPSGGVVVVGKTLEEGEERPLLIVRDSGGALGELPAPPSALLGPTQTFLKLETPPLLAAQEGTGGATRALVVRSRSGINAQTVLAYAAGNWSSEPVCAGFTPGPACTAPSSEFEALEIDANGGEAWLLGRGAEAGEGVELFRREPTGGEGGTPVWRQQQLGPPGSLGARFAQEEPLGVPLAARTNGQPLTVTPAGVWFDAVLTPTGGDGLDATAYFDIAQGEVTGSWCDLPAPAGLCTRPLGAELSSGDGRSFAWPPSPGQPFGSRVVTGVGQGAILSLVGASFERIALAGGDAGAAKGAALSAPDEGWLGAEPPLRLTRTPQPGRLQSWPVPFRRPLTAIAPEPGAAVGALSSEAIAVGAGGQVARYLPGIGWEPNFLLSSSGKRATPTLRGVAWPEPGRAFAVGDNAAMWIWQRATGLWEPDPASPPNLARANFTAIAFDPSRPSRGFAVGKQGVLLQYGRTWRQQPLPVGIPAEANFTSIAFAGSEAIATWRILVLVGGKPTARGGVIVNRGSGWEVDESAAAVLEGALPTRVAGLADGGAVIAVDGGRSQVIEREGIGAPWQTVPGGWLGPPAAVAAVREGGRVRAIASIARGSVAETGGDEEQLENQPAPGQPPLLADPYKLPGRGFVVRQTPTGWRDEQRQAFPLPEAVGGRLAYDLPFRPDPLLALLVSSDGQQGWAVGGETGTSVRQQGEAIQTAAVMRYGAAAAPPSNSSLAPISPEAGTASFAIGGNANCAGPCADLAGTGIAPDRWLRAAVGSASTVSGMRAFLYTGPGVAPGGPTFAERLGASLTPAAFTREEQAYSRRLESPLPAFAAPAESDVDRGGTLATFQSAFAGFGQPFGLASPGAGITPISQAGAGQGYYSFTSSGDGGAVRVVVLDYSLPTLGETQRCWLAGQLSRAGVDGAPAIVVGARDLARQAPNAAEDSSRVVPILASGAFPAGCVPSGPPAGASAYFFDYPSQNRTYSLISGTRSIPAFGSGTLGYVAPPQAQERDFVGDGGYLLAAVNVKARNQATNVAPVSAKLIPIVGSLALNATDGTLLRRSRPVLFEALARRPLAGTECVGPGAPNFCEVARPDPYVPIPTQCRGAKCPTGVFPEYTFTSSEPDIADFVAADPASLNPRNVLLVNEKPVLNPHSGLLCAFNAGTTTVTVSTGGLSYSQQVTVLAGSVQRPCGTTPLRNRKVTEPEPAATPPPAPAPAPTPAPTPTPAPPPPPPVPVTPAAAPPPPPPAPKPPQPQPPAPELFLPTPAPSLPFVPILPPPPAPAFQPTPPSGTSPVSAPQDEEEEEEAIESSQAAVAVRHPATEPRPLLIQRSEGGGEGGLPRIVPALLLLVAISAVAGIGGTRRRRTSQLRPAYQSTSDPRRYR